MQPCLSICLEYLIPYTYHNNSLVIDSVDRYCIPAISPDSQRDPNGQAGNEYGGPGDTVTAKQARTARRETIVKVHKRLEAYIAQEPLQTRHAFLYWFGDSFI